MRVWLIYRLMDLHNWRYSLLWRAMVALARGEDRLNEIFMARLGCGRIDVTDDEMRWYPELKRGSTRGVDHAP